MSKRLVLLFFFLMMAFPAFAQEPPITAQVDRSQITTDDTITLQVTVNSDQTNLSQPALPALEGFQVLSSSSSSQISIINNVVSSQVIYTYRLQPINAGILTIPPISVTLNGSTYSTDPISIEVSQGSGAPSQPQGQQNIPAPSGLSDQSVFVQAEVDNELPYVGQALIYTFRLYTAVSFFQTPSYDAPDFTGFWVGAKADPTQYRTQLNNRTYAVSELQTVLFPTSAGDVTIGPGTLIIPGDFFNPDVRLNSDSVKLNVRPLPDGAPAGFNGAVGQFDINASVDSAAAKVNEPVTLTVNIGGNGNMDTLSDPTWPDLNDWRVFDSKASTNTSFQGGQFKGTRSYQRLLVPGKGGDYTLPAVSFSYFDPQSESFQTISTDPINVTVSGDTTSAATDVPATQSSSPTASQQDVAQAGQDIRFIKPVPALLSTAAVPLTEQPFFWLLWAVPLIALMGNALWQQRQSHLRRDAGRLRASKAMNKARSALRQARQNSVDPYSASGQILLVYISEKLNQPVSGLTQRAIVDLLTSAGIASDLAQQVDRCLVNSEVGRFNPNGSHSEAIIDDVQVVITELEKGFAS